MSTQAQAYEHKIRALEAELTELRGQVLRVCRDLRDERAINRNLRTDLERLRRDGARLERVRQALRT